MRLDWMGYWPWLVSVGVCSWSAAATNQPSQQSWPHQRFTILFQRTCHLRSQSPSGTPSVTFELDTGVQHFIVQTLLLCTFVSGDLCSTFWERLRGAHVDHLFLLDVVSSIFVYLTQQRKWTTAYCLYRNCCFYYCCEYWSDLVFDECINCLCLFYQHCISVLVILRPNSVIQIMCVRFSNSWLKV